MTIGIIIAVLYAVFVAIVAYKVWRNYDAVCLWMASDMAKGLLVAFVIAVGFSVEIYLEGLK